MKHELIHAYDWCTVDFSPQSCLHIACSEIRAANLSGDCNYWLEFLRGNTIRVSGAKQRCVKRNAMKSVMMNPSCATNAEKAVDLAWKLCFNDLRPYDHIP